MGAQETLLFRLDVTDQQSVASAVSVIEHQFGRIDILINNAGTGFLKSFRESTTEDIELQLRTNLEGLIRVAHAFLPLIKEGVINIGSFLSKNTISDMAVYCASKFGVRGFTHALAREILELNISCVNPDMTATPLTGYQGRPIEAVPEVIFMVASGKLRPEPGGDIDVWEIFE